MQSALTLSLFSGIGGLDLGARLAGADIALATDKDGVALELLESATGVRTLVGDLDELLAGRLRDAWGSNRPVLLIGGPPCTAFSHAGFWISSKRQGTDPAAKLLTSYMAAVRTFEPRAFIMENVPGLTFTTHSQWLRGVTEEAVALGYSVSQAVLRASDFGVSQHRRRLFVVGVRDGSPPDLTQWPISFPVRTAGWAFDGLTHDVAEPDELPGELYADLLAKVPPGGNYLHFTTERGAAEPRFKYRGRYWSFLLKLDPSSPAPTLPAQRITYNGPFHWRNRHLRLREMARLQSFPDGYPLSDDLPLARRHLGNAVPPLMACAVAWRVLVSLGISDEADPPEALRVASEPDATIGEVMAATSVRSRASLEVA